MKKIFAISFLSVMAVVATTDAWAMQSNYNLATVNYVENFGYDLQSNMVEDRTIVDSQGRNWKDEDATTWAETYPDGYVPTIGRMNAAIAEAVADVDTSGLVDKAQVVKSDDKALSDGTTDLSSANADQIVPTVANVEANFAPRIADEVYYYGESNEEIDSSDPSSLPRGEYSVIVSVDGSGNVSFRWVPIQTTDCTSTVGYTCPPS